MPTFSVVNVGDGACSVLRPPPGVRGEITIIDCGVWRGDQRRAGRLLLSSIGRRLPEVADIVISHFDVDHWWGLKHFAKSAMTTLPKLRLIYPAMPLRVPENVVSMITTVGSGVAGWNLRKQLVPLVRSSTDVEMTPLVRGDSVILSGRDFEVLWPPAELSATHQSKVLRAVQDVHDLAETLAKDGSGELLENLKILAVEPIAPTREDDPDARAPGGPGKLRPIRIPAERLERYKKVAEAIKAVNNDLSLILASDDGFLVTFGDATTWVLKAIIPDLRRKYPVSDPTIMLAPHHGTFAVPAGFPGAGFCVAQAGSRHFPNWNKHLDSHIGALCLSTAASGTFTFW